jgi:biopolymer transport protein ExbB/TolQ
MAATWWGAMWDEITAHSAEVAAFLAMLLALVAVAGALIKARFDLKKQALAEVTTASDAVDKESERLVKFLTKQRDEYERALEKERKEFRAALEAQAQKYEQALASLRKHLEAEIQRLDNRVDMYGCDNAPTCSKRIRLNSKRKPTGYTSMIPEEEAR